MDLRSIATASILALTTIACASPEGSVGTEGTWVGSITSAGNVTTVVNESGSIWGGPATLVEEASIGVEAGEDAYMFGNVIGVGVADGRIFALDPQVHRVRVYDLNGVHVQDLGNEGDGPGEFRSPAGLAVGQRVFVRDSQIGRITVFDTGGELVDTWPIRPYFAVRPLVVTTAGELYVPYFGGMAPWGPEGQAGSVLPYPETEGRPPRMTAVRADGASFARDVPFWPLPVYAMSPTGATIHGAGDAYRFTVRRQDGTELHIEARAEPVMVAEAEAAWHRARVGEFLRQADAGWQWDAPEIPAVKPAFQAFIPAASGEVWVVRAGAGYEDDTCEADIPMQGPPDRCWKETRIVDAFAADGRYLGAVEVPDELRLEPLDRNRSEPARPYIHGDMVVGVVQDEVGTIMVKRYRLVLPGER
jgi:hypothetical protein